MENVITRHVIIHTLPCVKITSVRQDAWTARDAILQMLRRREAQQKVTEIWCERISCLVEGVCTIGLCVSRFSSEKVYSTERKKIGIESRRQILQGPVAPKKIGKERVHREGLFKSVNLMRLVLTRLSFRRGHKRKPCTKKDAPAKKIYKLKSADKAMFYSHIQDRATPAPQFKISRATTLRG